jgi:hypothetical protein
VGLKQTYRLAVPDKSGAKSRAALVADSVQRVAYRIAFSLTEVPDKGGENPCCLACGGQRPRESWMTRSVSG